MKSLLVYACIAFLMTACASSKNNFRENLAGNWELVIFPTTDKVFEEVFRQRKPELQFTKENETVTGNTGCNRLSGSYTVENNRFQFGNNVITTKMACPGYNENLFLDALRKINRYEIADNQLRFFQDSLLLMAFVKT